jgi:hypothetical protein
MRTARSKLRPPPPSAQAHCPHRRAPGARGWRLGSCSLAASFPQRLDPSCLCTAWQTPCRFRFLTKPTRQVVGSGSVGFTSLADRPYSHDFLFSLFQLRCSFTGIPTASIRIQILRSLAGASLQKAPSRCAAVVALVFSEASTFLEI